METQLKPLDFFEKCICDCLEESDFQLGDKSRKGTIRRKIKILESAINMLFSNQKLIIQENFLKNKVSCAFATSENSCTLGFILESNAKPVTLLKGNELKDPVNVEIIIEKDCELNTCKSIRPIVK